MPEQKPDTTRNQKIGVLAAGLPILAGLLHVFGVYDLNEDQTKALDDLVQWAVVAAGALFISDAGLRAARNHAVATTQAAALNAGTTPPSLPDESESPPGVDEVPISEATVAEADEAAVAIPPDELPSDDDEESVPLPDES